LNTCPDFFKISQQALYRLITLPTPKESRFKAVGAPKRHYRQKREEFFKVKIARLAVGMVHWFTTVHTGKNFIGH
jgi:uncharacterized protein (DUF2384 family)